MPSTPDTLLSALDHLKPPLTPLVHSLFEAIITCNLLGHAYASVPLIQKLFEGKCHGSFHLWTLGFGTQMVSVSWCMNKCRSRSGYARFTDEETEAQRDCHLEVTELIMHQAQVRTCKFMLSAFKGLQGFGGMSPLYND